MSHDKRFTPEDKKEERAKFAEAFRPNNLQETSTEIRERIPFGRSTDAIKTELENTLIRLQLPDENIKNILNFIDYVQDLCKENVSNIILFKPDQDPARMAEEVEGIMKVYGATWFSALTAARHKIEELVKPEIKDWGGGLGFKDTQWEATMDKEAREKAENIAKGAGREEAMEAVRAAVQKTVLEAVVEPVQKSTIGEDRVAKIWWESFIFIAAAKEAAWMAEQFVIEDIDFPDKSEYLEHMRLRWDEIWLMGYVPAGEFYDRNTERKIIVAIAIKPDQANSYTAEKSIGRT